MRTCQEDLGIESCVHQGTTDPLVECYLHCVILHFVGMRGCSSMCDMHRFCAGSAEPIREASFRALRRHEDRFFLADRERPHRLLRGAKPPRRYEHTDAGAAPDAEFPAGSIQLIPSVNIHVDAADHHGGAAVRIPHQGREIISGRCRVHGPVDLSEQVAHRRPAGFRAPRAAEPGLHPFHLAEAAGIL